MNDDHFKRLTDQLRYAPSQSKAEANAGMTLLERATRRRYVLTALKRLTSGKSARPSSRRPNVFFVAEVVIGSTPPADAPSPAKLRLAQSVTYRAFWARPLLSKRKKWQQPEDLGEPADCLMADCTICTSPSPVIGMDPPLTVVGFGITLSCRLFTLCATCPRIEPLVDESLRDRVDHALAERSVRAFAARRSGT